MDKFILYLIIWCFKPFFWFFPGGLALKLIRRSSWILSSLVIISPLRKNIANNLKKVYKVTAGLDKLANQYIRKIIRYSFEILNLKNMKPAYVDKIISYDNLKVLDKTLSLGKGVIIILMHCGNWELTIAGLSLKGYPIKAVINKPEGDVFIDYIEKSRHKNGIETINVVKQNMYRESIKALKENKIVVIAADTGATESDKNIPLMFLDHQLPVASGWATMALRTVTPVITLMNSTATPFANLQAQFGEPIDTAQFDSEKELINFVLKKFEKFIVIHPTEWFLPISDSETSKTFGQLI